MHKQENSGYILNIGLMKLLRGLYMNKFNELYREMLFLLFGIKPKNTGWTSFSQLRIVPDYIVDLEKGQVTGVVKHNEITTV